MKRTASSHTTSFWNFGFLSTGLRSCNSVSQADRTKDFAALASYPTFLFATGICGSELRTGIFDRIFVPPIRLKN